MSLDFIAYAGRPWPIDESSDTLRRVGQFGSLTEACSAFAFVDFVQLPPLSGRMRWRGWSPQAGMIVQIERPLSTATGLQLVC